MAVRSVQEVNGVYHCTDDNCKEIFFTREARNAHLQVHVPKYRRADVLRNLYWDEEMSLADVGEELGCSPATVHKHMKRHDIPTREHCDAAWLGRKKLKDYARDDQGRFSSGV